MYSYTVQPSPFPRYHQEFDEAMEQFKVGSACRMRKCVGNDLGFNLQRWGFNMNFAG